MLLVFQEDSTHLPTNVTPKEELTFYSRHPPSTTSTSTTTGNVLLPSIKGMLNGNYKVKFKRK